MHRAEQEEDSNLINHENSPRGSHIKLGFDSSMGDPGTEKRQREILCAQSRGKGMNRTVGYPM